jgi:hypothetical protein
MKPKKGFHLNTSRSGRVSRLNSMPHLKMNRKLSALALASVLFVGLPLTSSSAFVAVSVGIAPPAIPVYQQPFCPAPGYIWTPGYWAYSDFGYYWVPGVWVLPPRIGFLWTPGFWGYRGGSYYFNDGYWGSTVGFYGGINYGYGYGGYGYYGGEWAGNTFRYNTAVTRVNPAVIQNTYVNREVVNKNTGSRASFNGPGGATAKPTAREQVAAKAEHAPATPEQRSRVEAAKNDPALHAKNNKGKPKAEAINRLDRKNGRQSAAAAAEGSAATQKQAGARKQAGAEKRVGAEKATGRGAHEANGNSAFGHRQGDATTRTKGSQNNAYGKAQSADAHDSHPKAKANRTEQAAASHARKASPTRHNAEPRKTASAPRAVQHAPAAPRRPQAVRARQAPSAARSRGPAQAPQNAKKKKRTKEKPGDGQ